jgi:hypothetical protein
VCVCHLHTHTYFVLSFPSTYDTASPSGPCPPSKSSSLPNLQIVSPDLLLSVSPSQAYLRFSLNKILYGAEVTLTPNLKPQGSGYPFQSGSLSLSCPGSQPNTQPQTSRTRISLSVWVIIFALSVKTTSHLTSNLKDQDIPFSLGHHLCPVRLGKPCQLLRCPRRSFQDCHHCVKVSAYRAVLRLSRVRTAKVLCGY